MGAATRIYVKCLVAIEEWREVSAVTLDDAKEQVETQPRVIRALGAQYDQPDEIVTSEYRPV